MQSIKSIPDGQVDGEGWGRNEVPQSVSTVSTGLVQCLAMAIARASLICITAISMWVLQPAAQLIDKVKLEMLTIVTCGSLGPSSANDIMLKLMPTHMLMKNFVSNYFD